MVDKLVEWGVSVVFGLPGDKIGLMLDALRRRQDKIRFVLVRHEEGAAFMASGYAKFTGKLGVCVSTAVARAVGTIHRPFSAKRCRGVVVVGSGQSPPSVVDSPCSLTAGTHRVAVSTASR